MKRHLIAGYFGPSDRPDISVSTDEQTTKIELVAIDNSLVNGISSALISLNSLGVFPSEIGVDLLVFAVHVHAADTRISRVEQSQDSWTREIRIVVPVSDPTLWTSTTNTLTRILNFLTGDIWTINFRPRPTGFTNIAPLRELRLLPIPFNIVSLFSGGLDSLIGAIDLLESGRTPLLVSHSGEPAISAGQDTLYSNLKQHYRASAIDRLRVWMTFPDGLVAGVSSENSTRGRSFLFFSLAVFAGTGFGAKFKLSVPENGLIALNVPLDLLRLGSNSTRTTHPFYIARWNNLLTELGIDGKIENPYWNKTKGEMIAECKEKELLRKLVPTSLSCSAVTKGRWTGHGIEHCGYCLPCLIRRASLDAAWGVGNDATDYTVPNLRAQVLDTNESIGKQVRSFQLAIERLQKNPALAKILIHKPGSLADVEGQIDGLADVYRRGLSEVARLLDGVVTRPI